MTPVEQRAPRASAGRRESRSPEQILAGALAIVLAVTVSATLIPARRVSRTDPANALRAD